MNHFMQNQDTAKSITKKETFPKGSYSDNNGKALGDSASLYFHGFP